MLDAIKNKETNFLHDMGETKIKTVPKKKLCFVPDIKMLAVNG
jgi:hypothetical protein